MLKKLNWRDDWGRLLGLVAIGLGSLNLIRGGVPPELAIGIPVALLLVGLPGMYYMLRERRSRGTGKSHVWEAVKRRWRENKPWIVAAAILLIVNATVAVYMNAKADAMAEAALGASMS